MPYENLTKEFIDKLPYAEGGKQIIYRDTRLEGFCVRVTHGSKSYVVIKTVNGKQVKFTLGRCGKLKHDDARRLAGETLNNMAQGLNPIIERKEARSSSVTLAQALEDFLAARNTLKANTRADYRYRMGKHFGDWLERPLREIRKDMIGKRHKELGDERGPSTANLAFRYLRSIFTFAMGKYENSKGQAIILENPVRRLSHAQSWYKVARRQTHIEDTALPAFFDALDTLRQERTNSAIPDYLELLLLTGLRKVELASLPWADVNLAARKFTVKITKNGEPHTLPMPDRVFEILSIRHKAKGGSDYVFPGEGKSGFLVEPRSQVKKVTAMSGVAFMLHDLRRTFATVAVSLNIDGYVIKALLNHKVKSDVTEGYFVHSAESLRLPMQAITSTILTRAGRRGGAGVLPFKPKVAMGESGGA